MNDRCDFCGKPAHFGACAAMLAFTERVKARIFARLNSPHPCRNCGDPTCADMCAACQEWEGAVIRGIVHDGMVVA